MLSMLFFINSLPASTVCADVPAICITRTVSNQAVPASLLTRIGEQMTLADALSEIARQERLAILVEGNPPRLPHPTLGEIFTRAKKEPISVRELIQRMADAYGYSVDEKNGVLLLAQRYERPDLFPEVSIAEIRHFLTSAAKIINRFDPAFSKMEGVDSEFRQFMASLPPERIAQWRNDSGPGAVTRDSRNGQYIGALRKRLVANAANPGKKTFGQTIPEMMEPPPEKSPSAQADFRSFGIPMSAFSPSQQQFLKNLGLEQFVGDNVGRIRRGINMIDGIGAKSTAFTYSGDGPPNDRNMLRCFTCDYRYAGKQYRTFLAPVTRVFMDFGSAITFHKPVADADPSDPLPADYDAKGKPFTWTERTEFSTTLGAFAAKISVRSRVPLRVAPALASKRINVIGAWAGDARTSANAVAAIFNLSVQDVDGAIVLDMPPTPKITRLEQVAAAIDRITPAPIKRLNFGWCRIGARELNRVKKKSENSEATVEEGSVRVTYLRMYEGMNVMQRQAIRRLRILTDPKIQAAKDGRVVWEELDEEAQWLSQFIVSCKAFLSTFAQSTAGMPEYITRFQESHVIGRVYESQGRTWLQIGLRTPSGRQGFNRVGIVAKP